MRNTDSKRLIVLDGVRGLAVLLVILSHLSNHHAYVLYLNFSGAGKYGVYLFFALSAYLLTDQFLERGLDEGFSRYELFNYFFRRFLRIYPLYLLVLATSCITTTYLADGFPYSLSGQEFIGHMLLQQGKSVLWSVPVEFKYYFLLPLVSLALLLLARWVRLVAGLTLVCAVFCQWFFTANDGSIALGQYLPIFLLGSLCPLIYRKMRASWLTPLCRILSYLCMGALLLLLPSLVTHIAGTAATGYLIRGRLIWGVLFSVLILSVVHAESYIKRFLSSGPMRGLGKISFSVYLLHVPIIDFAIHRIPNAWLGGAVATVAFLSVATLSYFLVERPLFRLHLNDLSQRSAPASPAET